MLKKDDWQEREPVTDQRHDRSGQPDKRGENHLNVDHLMHGNWGLRISGHGAAEVCSPEDLRYAEANPTCEIHKGCCTSHQNPRPKSFARIFLPR